MELETFGYSIDNGWSIDTFPALDSENTLLLVFSSREFINHPSLLMEMLKSYPYSKIVGFPSEKVVIAENVSGHSVPYASILDQQITLAVI